MAGYNRLAPTTPNGAVPQASKPKFSVALQSDAYQKLIANTLRDEKIRNRFIADISTVVSNNPALQDCDSGTILSAGFMAQSLNLSMSTQLGQCYLVPFNDRKNNRKVAQFQIGYKGYIQLAMRSGQYRDINVCEVREGELAEFDPLRGFTFNWDRNYISRKSKKVIGYVAYFQLLNGFEKQIYYDYQEMLDHADTYSSAFSKEAYERLQKGLIPQNELWKYSSFWYKDFNGMAFKTALRQIISKWGPMSIEMQEAYKKDQAVMEANGDYDYVDSNNGYNEENTIDANPPFTPNDFTTPNNDQIIEEEDAVKKAAIDNFFKNHPGTISNNEDEDPQL